MRLVLLSALAIVCVAFLAGGTGADPTQSQQPQQPQQARPPKPGDSAGGGGAGSAASAGGGAGASSASSRLDALQAEVNAIRDEVEALGGTRNLRAACRNLRGRLAELRVRMDELDEAIEDAGGSQEDLEATRAEFDENQRVVTGEDVAQETGEKAVEAAARQAISKGAGRVLGWLGLAMDALEYGGKWGLKQGDLDALDDAIDQNRVNLIDLYQVSSALSAQIDGTIADIKRCEKLQARDEAIFPELAELRARERLFGGRATKRAVLDREHDPAGDRAEREAYNRRGITSTTGTPPPAARGVTPGRTAHPRGARVPETPPSGGSSKPSNSRY